MSAGHPSLPALSAPARFDLDGSLFLIVASWEENIKNYTHTYRDNAKANQPGPGSDAFAVWGYKPTLSFVIPAAHLHFSITQLHIISSEPPLVVKASKPKPMRIPPAVDRAAP